MSPPPFRRVLVANRGEIAVRVLRACQELGMHAIAVYSEADRGALHTRLADEAHAIGPPAARDSYLDGARILEVARLTGAEAIHPGYGFLSENADFAAACAAAGVTFVGPPPAAMRLMGDKAAARRLVARHDVPVVPGYDGDEQGDETLLARAIEIGFPVLIKAAAGGGGRGMRVVREVEAFSEALEGARREARAAFGDGAMILERYVAPARHVEVQVLGDHHGALIHLGERECSVQRRHQKVIEESPSPAVGPELRAALGEAAIRAARAAGYANAGTCEFLLDGERRFYFIEMNARLQVEHPVTELVSGLDLVRRQLEIAAGRPLGLRQEDVALRGHAIECRVYAEDPSRDFLPSGGHLDRFAPPLGYGLRHDVGFAEGDVVNTYYDAMLAKLIAYGEDRATALARARWALERYVVAGLQTNLPLLRWVLDHPRFAAGETTTDFLARAWRPLVEAPPLPEALAAAAAFELTGHAAEPTGDPWRTLGPWRLLDEGIVLAYQVEGAPRTVIGRRDDRPDNPTGSAWSISVGDRTHDVVVESDGLVTVGAVHEPPLRLRVARREDDLLVTDAEADRRYAVRRAGPPDVEATGTGAGAQDGAARLGAPMPGRVVVVAAGQGDRVRERQTLVVLEAMKIEHTIVAPLDGIVRAVHCQAGQTVEGGALLVELERQETGDRRQETGEG